MAQRFSQNGWPAYATPQQGGFVRFQCVGQGWWAANADVAVVFAEFIERFDREVEEITQKTLDDWTYANRLVRGSSSVVSNHGSATAADINALQHPRGRHDTFTIAKAAKVRAIKNSITDDSGEPVLGLGMDYRTVVDDMHVEVVANAARVKQAANKIRRAKEEDVTEAELEAAVVKVLTTKKIVKNVPTAAQAKAGVKESTMTVVEALSNMEKQQDGDTDGDKTVVQKLDQILAALQVKK